MGGQKPTSPDGSFQRPATWGGGGQLIVVVPSWRNQAGFRIGAIRCQPRRAKDDDLPISTCAIPPIAPENKSLAVWRVPPSSTSISTVAMRLAAGGQLADYADRQSLAEARRRPSPAVAGGWWLV